LAYVNMTYHAGNAVIDPERLLAKSGLRAGMHVADFGTGRTGHMIFPAARIVGASRCGGSM
jgi:cyclopropane fatty-acyl-phospholipid synthase-like methyltransferase